MQKKLLSEKLKRKKENKLEKPGWFLNSRS